MQILEAPQRIIASARTSRRAIEGLGAEIVADGVMPLIRPHDVQTYDASDDQTFAGWKAGVYDQHGRVCDASLLDRHWTRVAVPFWSRELDPDDVERRRGEAMYGGLLFHHFGRFLRETTNRLWWCLAHDFKGPIILQNTRPRRGVPDFASRFFELLGLGNRVIVADCPLGYDRIVVPQRSYVGQSRFHQEFQAPFLVAGAAAERLPIAEADAYGAGMAGVYLSRTRFANRSSAGEAVVEDRLAKAGFHIAHTQEMPLEAQILLIRRHKTIAGIAGSALHNILFSPESVRPIFICKDHDINANFFIIDELMNNDGLYVYAGSAVDGETPRTARELLDDHWNDVVLDAGKVVRCLEGAGILPAKADQAPH